jgi:hypothetical protein
MENSRPSSTSTRGSTATAGACRRTPAKRGASWRRG